MWHGDLRFYEPGGKRKTSKRDQLRAEHVSGVGTSAGVLALPAITPAAAPTPAAEFNLDTPLETLVADAAAKAVLDKDMGSDITKHPLYDNFKTLSLNSVAPLSGGAMSDDLLKKIGADLAALK